MLDYLDDYLHFFTLTACSELIGYAILIYFCGGNGVRWMLAAVDRALELLSALSCIVISQKNVLEPS